MLRLHGVCLGILLVAGCLEAGAEPRDDGAEKRQVSSPRERAERVDAQPGFDAAALTWRELHEFQNQLQPDDGNWGAMRIRLTNIARPPGDSNASFSIRYVIDVTAEGATDAFMLFGWKFSQAGTPGLRAMQVTDRASVAGSASGGCARSCDENPPEYYVIVGSKSGPVTASFGLFLANETSSPDALRARPLQRVAADIQGFDAHFGDALRRTDAAGSSTWYDRGHVFHQETTTTGPISVDRTTVVNTSKDLPRPGILFTAYSAGGLGSGESSYLLELGEKTYQNRAEIGPLASPFWSVAALTPAGPMKLQFSQTITGTEAQSDQFVGQIHMDWSWLDQDLATLYAWDWQGIDAR